MSKVSKGNYYRRRTKEWLESLGFWVENLERQQRIYRPGNQVMFIKRDIWGADLIARNEERVIFIQVKSNKSHITQGIKEISKGPWPSHVERWVVYWPSRRRLTDGPDIVEIGEEVQ